MAQSFVAVLLWTACVCALAQSQPVSGVEQNHHSAQASHPQSPNSAAVAQPVAAVEPATHDSSANNPYKEKEPSGVSRFRDGSERWLVRLVVDPIALFTLVLTVFTGLLWIATKSIAARQHELQRLQFIAGNRPKIAIRRCVVVTAAGNPEYVKYSAHNIGGTDCRITKVSAAIWFPPQDQHWPADSDYQEPLEECLELKGGESKTLLCNPALDVRNKLDLSFGYGSDTRLFFVGFVSYVDDANVVRQTGFLRQYDWEAHRFRVVDDRDYEYQD